MSRRDRVIGNVFRLLAICVSVTSMRRALSAHSGVVSNSQFPAAAPRTLVRRAGGHMNIAERLEQELEETTARLRQDVGLALLDEGAYAVADSRGIVDEVDGAQRSIEREMTLVTRSRLRERAQRLAGALDRVREGLYGLGEE